MFRSVKIITAGLLLGSGLVLAGCASTAPAASANNAVSNKAITCEKCQVTYVQVSDKNDKGRIIGYSNKKQMECPDCKSAVENFFATGKFQHACKTCGDSMDICEAH